MKRTIATVTCVTGTCNAGYKIGDQVVINRDTACIDKAQSDNLCVFALGAILVTMCRLEPGKKADVIVVNTRKPHLTPMYHPYSHMVYAARGSDVETVVINGRVVMEHRRLKTLDVAEVMAGVRRIALEMQAMK